MQFKAFLIVVAFVRSIMAWDTYIRDDLEDRIYARENPLYSRAPRPVCPMPMPSKQLEDLCLRTCTCKPYAHQLIIDCPDGPQQAAECSHPDVGCHCGPGASVIRIR